MATDEPSANPDGQVDVNVEVENVKFEVDVDVEDKDEEEDNARGNDHGAKDEGDDEIAEMWQRGRGG